VPVHQSGLKSAERLMDLGSTQKGVPMYARLATLILPVVLPLALHAQTVGVFPDPHQAPGRTVVADAGAGQRYMQREQQTQDRRGQQAFDYREKLELTERQRELDRQQRDIGQQRRQLLQLQAKIKAHQSATQK
jgi:hypothetical protein